jgi:putative ABC transport system permease protein
MAFLDYIKTALDNIGSSKLRSLLTSLGIIIGIGSVVLISSIGGGVSSTITDAFSGLGSTQMTISSSAPVAAGDEQSGFGGRPSGGGGFGGAAVASTLSVDDAAALTSVQGVAAAAPVINVVSKVAGPDSTLDIGVTGTTPTYQAATAKTLVEGRIFSKAAPEVVLNQSAAKGLFGTADPLGQPVKIGDVSYTVVGVFTDPVSPFAQSGAGRRAEQSGANAAVYMPVGPALTLAGTQKVSQIAVAASSPEVVGATIERIRTTLTQRHDNVEDFTILSFQQLTASFAQVFNTLTIFLAAIAAISLLVGGIGIMNIMLVTVTERTREIGIAKAIGATSGSVVVQFLVESVMLSVIGGVLGLLVAWLGTVALGQLLGLPAVVSISTIATAVGVSAAIGIFFGVFPAWRAARLDPIVALRHE